MVALEPLEPLRSRSTGRPSRTNRALWPGVPLCTNPDHALEPLVPLVPLMTQEALRALMALVPLCSLVALGSQRPHVTRQPLSALPPLEALRTLWSLKPDIAYRALYSL